MIAILEGTLINPGPDAVVMVGGLGLQVQVSGLAAETLPGVGESVRLWTHLSVREDGWSLYGFPDPGEREMFRLLISVSGIGPKVAMGMLSRATAAAIAGHLATGDEKALAALPGIGKKSAARLVVELGQRVPALSIAGAVGGMASGGPLHEAVAVLGAMGLPATAAENALRRAREQDAELETDLERWVKAALRHI